MHTHHILSGTNFQLFISEAQHFLQNVPPYFLYKSYKLVCMHGVPPETLQVPEVNSTKKLTQYPNGVILSFLHVECTESILANAFSFYLCHNGVTTKLEFHRYPQLTLYLIDITGLVLYKESKLIPITR